MEAVTGRGRAKSVTAILDENERYLREAYESAERPLDQVAAIADAQLRFHLDHPRALRLLDVESDDPPEQVVEMVGELAEAIERAVGEGEARPVEPVATATFLWGSWNGALSLHARGLIDESALKASFEQGSDILVEGLRQRS